MESIQYDVLDGAGKKTGTVELLPEVFGRKASPAEVYEVIKWQLSKRRAGTHAALTRGQMKGGGKKLYRQKGTGRARAGAAASPTRVGGSVAHGPSPRNYCYRLPRRTRRHAICSVLSEKASKGDLLILNELDVDSGKTRDMAKVLKAIGVETASAVVVPESTAAAEKKQETMLAARNLPGIKVLDVAGINVFDLLKHRFLVTTESTVHSLQERLSAPMRKRKES